METKNKFEKIRNCCKRLLKEAPLVLAVTVSSVIFGIYMNLPAVFTDGTKEAYAVENTENNALTDSSGPASGTKRTPSKQIQTIPQQSQETDGEPQDTEETDFVDAKTEPTEAESMEAESTEAEPTEAEPDVKGTTGENDREIDAGEDPYHVYRSVMPLASTDQVFPAKDYGACGKSFLSGTDQIPAVNTGIFAENGVFTTFTSVEDSYFSDALFIGDSRTVGLYGYSSLKNASSFFAKESMSVYSVLTKQYPLYEMGSQKGTGTLSSVLAAKQYRKIYISLGVNELGIGNSESYYEKYRSVIEQIRAAQPDAIIFIQGIMHVSEAKSSRDSVFNNTNIVEKNTWLASLANGRDIFYIDMNSVYCDDNGNLKEGQSGDGIHLKAANYEEWHSYLKSRGIVRGPEDLGTASAEE